MRVRVCVWQCVCVCGGGGGRPVYFYDFGVESKLSGQFVRLYFSKLRFFGGQVNNFYLIAFWFCVSLGISVMRTLHIQTSQH